MIALAQEAADITDELLTFAKPISPICPRLGAKPRRLNLVEVSGYPLATIVGDPSLECRSLIGTLDEAIPDHDQSIVILMDRTGNAFAPKRERMSVPYCHINVLTYDSKQPYQHQSHCDRKYRLGRFLLLLLVIMVLNACATPHNIGRVTSPFPCKSYRCIGQGPR